MTIAIDTGHAPKFEKSVSFGAVVARWFAGIADGFRAHRLYTELSGKSDAELAEIGLARNDIPAYVAKSVFGIRN